MSETNKKEEREEDQAVNEQIKDMGQVTLEENSGKHRIHLLTIIGEVEGMNLHLITAKPRNMNTYCQSLQ